jgi:cell cycle sensor histidine kinase DivJ
MSDVWAPFETIVDGWVHPAAARDASERQRHRSFIASHLMGGLLAAAALPVHLAVWGAPGTPEAIALAWLAAPLLVAFFLSRTGRFEGAHLLSALSFTGLVAYVAWWTGGIASFVLGWLVIVPLEAALSGSRRVVTAAIMAAAAAALGLYVAGEFGFVPAGHAMAAGSAVLMAGAVTAIAYAGGIAVGLDKLHRAGQAAARAEEARYRLLAENATDMISRHTRSGLVLFASPAAEALTGCRTADLADDGLFARVHVSDRPAFLQAFADAAHIGGIMSVTFRLRCDSASGGAYRWVEMRCRPAKERAEDGSVEIVAVTRDIEDRKRVEDELRAANDRAEQASEAKTRFLANMSHELRTPLNAIIGFSEMMTHESFHAMGPEKTPEYAQLIHDSGRHLLDVVNGILDMSKIESGCFDILPEPFDVRDLIANAVAIMQPVAEKAGVDLIVELPANAPELIADRRACKQILLNLLSNAVKFTERGGRVTAGVAFDGRSAYLSVTDTGIGIAEQDIPRLGTPFMQAQASYDRRFEGTGLGLSVVKGLATLHGGALLIRSKLGQGTTATVRLPLEAELAQPVLPLAQPTITPFPARREEAEVRPAARSERIARHA